MVGVARHENMRDQRLGGQAARDQPRRRRGLHHDARAGLAGSVLRFQHHPDPWQVRRQRATVGAALRGARTPQVRIALLRLGLARYDRGLQILEAELQLLLRQPFRLPAELQALQLYQQVSQPVVLVRQRVALLGQYIAFGHRRQHQRAQRRDIGGQVRVRGGSGVGHTANPTPPRSVGESAAAAVRASN